MKNIHVVIEIESDDAQVDLNDLSRSIGWGGDVTLVFSNGYQFTGKAIQATDVGWPQ